MAIILNDTDDFGICSVKLLNPVTCAGTVKISFAALETFPNVELLPWV